MALPAITDFPQSASIVSRWKLNEVSGTRNDSKASNHLTDNNTVTSLANAKFTEIAADFEVSNTEYLSITDGAQTGLDITGNLSMSCWIKFESLPGAADASALMAKFDSSGNQQAYRFAFMGSNNIRLMLSDDGANITWVDVSWTPTAGVWYHLCVAYSAAGGSASFYINGILLGSGSGLDTSIFNSSAAFKIGQVGTSTETFDGLMMDAMIWNVTLTAAEAAQLYNAYLPLPDTADLPQSASIAARWKLDEISGTRNDSVGTNHLTDNNTVTALTSGLGAVAADFELSNSEYLSCADNAALSITGNLSFSVWFKVESSAGSAYRNIMSKYEDGAAGKRQYSLRLSDANQIEYYGSTDGSNTALYCLVAFTPANDVWYHLTVVYTAAAGEVRFFINGIQQGATQTGQPTAVFDSSGAFWLGRQNSYFDGVMQDAILWSAALTVAEVKTLYLSYLGLPATAEIPESGSILSRWPLTEYAGQRGDFVGSNHLTDNNTVASAAPGIVGRGVDVPFVADFELSNSEYLSIADGSQTGLDPGANDLSVFAWVKIESQPGNSYSYYIASKWQSGSRGWMFRYFENDDLAHYFLGVYFNDASGGGDDGAYYKTDDQVPLTLGQWHHVGFTFDASASTLKFYVDGEQVSNTEITSNNDIRDSGAPFQIGTSPFGNYFDGMIQDEILWSGAVLSDAQVEELYDLYTTVPAEGGGLVALERRPGRGIGRGIMRP